MRPSRAILLLSYVAGARLSAFTDKLMTSVSTKGQVILPKSIRQRRHWDVGTRLIVEDTPDGVLLRAAPIFRQTRPDEVFASLKVAGPPKTLEEMERVSPPKQGVDMLAIDTNIVVRYLTGDHPEQSPKARALIDSEDVFVCTTVLNLKARGYCGACTVYRRSRSPGRWELSPVSRA